MDVLLAALEVGEMAGLVVDVEHLLVSLLVERSELLTSRGTGGLLEVRVQTAPASGGGGGHTKLGIDGLSLLGCLVLAVELVESVHESVADSVLVIESDSALNGLVADDIAVGTACVSMCG